MGLSGTVLTSQFLEELLLVEPVFEGLAPVYKHYWDFVGELALEAIVGFDVNFAPAEAAAAFQLLELLFHNFAKMASLTGIHDDFAEQGHGRKSSKPDGVFL